MHSRCEAYIKSAGVNAKYDQLVERMQESVDLCHDAIANGSLRTDVPAVKEKLALILDAYNSISTQDKSSIDALVHTEVSKEMNTGTK